jgi:hypothetical protein
MMLLCHNISSRLVLCSFTFLIALLHHDNALVQGETFFPSEDTYYGGDGGYPFTDHSSTARSLESMEIYANYCNGAGPFVSALKVKYASLETGAPIEAFTAHGNTASTLALNYVPEDGGERIVSMQIRHGGYIDNVRIETNYGRTFSAGSTTTGASLKTITFEEGEEFKYFEGRGSGLIDAIRIVSGPVPATPAPTLAPTIASTDAPVVDTAAVCLDETLTLLEAVQDDYPSNESIIESTINNKRTEIVDFDDASANALYERKCSENVTPGVYVELTYESECVNGENTVNVFVARQPRCYSQVCDLEVDEQALFEKYALRLTEERNGGGWTCTGQLVESGGGGSGCEYETTVLNGIDEVFKKNFEVETMVEEKTFLFIFPKAEKEVTFSSFTDPEVIGLEAACEEGGGTLRKAGYSTFLCGESATYVVTDFPVCLGLSCTAGDSYEAAITSQFQVKIVEADEQFKDTPDVVCTLTASSSKPLLGAATALGVSMLVAVWHLLM